jgi:hypothetical protein
MEGIFAMLGGGDDPQRWIDTLLGIRPGTHGAGGETS